MVRGKEKGGLNVPSRAAREEQVISLAMAIIMLNSLGPIPGSRSEPNASGSTIHSISPRRIERGRGMTYRVARNSCTWSFSFVRQGQRRG